VNEDKYKWRAVAGFKKGIISPPVEDMSVEDEIRLCKHGMEYNVGDQDGFLYFFCRLIMAEMKKVRRDHCE
jgi:hypothetical protein